MTEDIARFAPARAGPTGLFLDSSALFAYFYPNDERHEDAIEFFDALRAGDLPYRPLFANDYILDEAVTTIQNKVNHETACACLETIRSDQNIRYRYVTDDIIDTAADQFTTYDDHEISFTDHVIAAHAAAETVNHVLTFDGDFDTLSLTTIPRR